MIPLKDTIPSRKFPIMTLLIIGINIYIFLHEISLGQELERFIEINGMIPKNFFQSLKIQWPQFLFRLRPFVTSIFLHGGWLHLIGNMWSLWIFGDNVEDQYGHIKFFILYIVMGVAAGFAHAFIYPSSEIPVVGASGAIAGIMGSYFIFYPRAKILTLFPIFIFISFIKIPAYIFLGIWFLFQFFSGSAELANTAGDCCGVAWWAHIGGFLFGIIIAIIFYRKP